MAKTVKQILEMVSEASLKDIKSPTAAKNEISAAKKEMARMDKLGRLLPHEASKYHQLARKVKTASSWLKEVKQDPENMVHQKILNKGYRWTHSGKEEDYYEHPKTKKRAVFHTAKDGNVVFWKEPKGKRGSVKEGVSPESDHQQNKRHHGNTTMEFESAPTKVAKMKYRGPIKKVPGTMKEGLAPKQVYSSMLSPDSETAKRTGGLKGKNMTKDKKRLMGMSAKRIPGAQIRTEEDGWVSSGLKKAAENIARYEASQKKNKKPVAKKTTQVKEDHSLKAKGGKTIIRRQLRPDGSRMSKKGYTELKLTALGKVHRDKSTGELVLGPAGPNQKTSKYKRVPKSDK